MKPGIRVRVMTGQHRGARGITTSDMSPSVHGPVAGVLLAHTFQHIRVDYLMCMTHEDCDANYELGKACLAQAAQCMSADSTKGRT